MSHSCSPDDLRFRDAFESLAFPKADFKHRQHLRLAYVYLCDHDTSTAHKLMRRGLFAFIGHHGIDPAKYNETITKAWILAVRHFMEKTPDTFCFEDLIAAHPGMLDSRIMLTHYSAERLNSPEARAAFHEPDLAPIPRHEA